MAKKIMHISKEQVEASQKKLEEMMSKDDLGKEQLAQLEEIKKSIEQKHQHKEEEKS